MSIEAMKQALEALEKAVSTCFDGYAHEQVMSRPEHFINQTITSLRQAIANEALDKKAENARELGLDYEPVQAEKQEPVAYPDGYVVGPCICGSWPGGKCLKCPRITPQPQREWVGLTLEDKKEYLAQDFGGSRADAMDWAEQRLKEKNCG